MHVVAPVAVAVSGAICVFMLSPVPVRMCIPVPVRVSIPVPVHACCVHHCPSWQVLAAAARLQEAQDMLASGQMELKVFVRCLPVTMQALVPCLALSLTTPVLALLPC